MKNIILAGGSGTRLWPVSRKGFPKQFMKINGNESLLCKTISRLLKVSKGEEIYIVTNEDYKFLAKEEMKNVSESLEENILLEPVGRNTAPAIALAIKYLLDKVGCNNKEIVFVTPSDHILKPVDLFVDYVKKAEIIARDGYIVTFGIRPDNPETGYGYIKAEMRGLLRGSSGQGSEDRRDELGIDYFKVEKFTEKPDVETAKKYLKDNKYYWNSGMFAFSIESMFKEFERHAPEIYDKLNGSFEDVVTNFENMPDISIDYAVLEKTDKAVVMPLEITWSDIGSWDSLFNILDRDAEKNVKMGNVIDIDTKNSMIMGGKRLISTIGIDSLIVVETDDAIMIAKQGHSQRVKEIVNKLKEAYRKEIVEHTTVYRPWGSYTVLEEGSRYKIKRIVVKPGEKLSLQMHHHRSEHWIVIKGTAKVNMSNEEKFIHENESIYVPKSTPHRLENPGKIELELIEVQNGEYVEEDDIMRFDDIYGRTE